MIIHLIRHGRTRANELSLYCGSSDVALSDNGVAELINLKKEINYPTSDVYIVSGLLRTIQTAEILFSKQNLIEIKEFREMCFGDFEMMSHEELKNNECYKSWISNIETTSPPNGESKQEFIKRVEAGLTKVCRLYENKSSIIVVAHGGVISAIMQCIFPYKNNFYEWQPENGRGYSIFLEDVNRYEKI